MTSTTRPPLLDLVDVTVIRNGQCILDDVHVTVAPGEIVTLVGQNGAGKSTLVKVALGLMRPDSGTVMRKPGLRIGYQPQRLTMDAGLPLSVRRFLTLTHQQPEIRLREALDQVQMTDMLDTSVHTLSGGEMQRVTLARAMLRDPELLVLDEPTQNVDMSGSVDIYRLIADLRTRTGCGVLLISHDLNIVMAATDRVYCLNGHICCSGLPADVSRNPEFLRLLGPTAAGTLTIYPHTHDHVHTPGEHTHAHHSGHHHDHHHHDGPSHA
ncbi:MAG: metal ABC transporter ATP-binding protein [Rhodospirillaceae bacterium]|nr:MAG: metal ABC transporter ATP-binding protein [Rhodospirillaceae bacterium]